MIRLRHALVGGPVVLLLAVAQAPVVGADDHPSRTGAETVTLWNEIAVRTISTENATPIPSSALYFGFVSAAVHEAVQDAERDKRSDSRKRHRRGDRHCTGASVEAAVATAAHDVMAEYFPSSASALAADLERSLDAVRDGRSKDKGIDIGEEAAEAVIEEREDDGRDDAAITFQRAAAPGVWRPTTAGATMLVPWLGFVEPLLLDSVKDIELRGPDKLTSSAYAEDFAEAKATGSLNSSVRTAAPTETAHFWNVNSVTQYQAALRDLAERQDMKAGEAAELFAAVNMTMADSLIVCWRAKYDYGYWRPVTAIHEAASDGNAATTADPAWTSLIPAPPYPEYPSGHACIVGAVAASLTELADDGDDIDLYMDSVVAGVAKTRHFTSAEAMVHEARNGRIWLASTSAKGDGGLHLHREEGGRARASTSSTSTMMTIAGTVTAATEASSRGAGNDEGRIRCQAITLPGTPRCSGTQHEEPVARTGGVPAGRAEGSIWPGPSPRAVRGVHPRSGWPGTHTRHVHCDRSCRRDVDDGQ